MSENDFSALEEMIYSGRGIMVGMTPKGNPVVGYTLTGRSPSSQARRLVKSESGVVRTDVTDKAQLEQGSPALLLYPALVPVSHLNGHWLDGYAILASNGAQTNLLYSSLAEGYTHPEPINAQNAVEETMFGQPVCLFDHHGDRWIDITSFEPDVPNNTPRISAIVVDDYAAFHIVYAALDESDENPEPFRKHEVLPFVLEPGQGSLLTTYDGGNENPLKRFMGEPRPVTVGMNDPVGILHSLYDAIEGGQNPEDDYRVAVAVTMFDKSSESFSTIVRNRFEVVE